MEDVREHEAASSSHGYGVDHPSASDTSGETFLHSTELRNEAAQLQDCTVPSFCIRIAVSANDELFLTSKNNQITVVSTIIFFSSKYFDGNGMNCNTVFAVTFWWSIHAVWCSKVVLQESRSNMTR